MGGDGQVGVGSAIGGWMSHGGPALDGCSPLMALGSGEEF